MSTKNETDSQNTLNYDPASLALYKKLTQGGGNVLSQYMNNPFGNAWYNLGLGQSMRGATQLGQQNINALTNNMRVSGIGGGAGNAFQQAMMSNIGRGNQALRSQANMGNVFQALQRQMQATGMGMSFNPLLTGETGKSTQTQSGLGTWLPQLIGTLGGAAMGAFGGGAMGAGAMPGMPKTGGPMSVSGGFGNLMPLPTPGAPSPFMFGNGF
jgi:hypothetical protein